MSFTEELFTAARISMNDFRKILDELIDQDESRALQSASQLFLNIEFKKMVSNYFETDSNAFNKVLRDSYYHDNGFDKLVLFKGNNFKIRLHSFYPTTKITPMENVHDHRWVFASSVLQGGFEAEFFKEKIGGEELLYRYTYYADKVGGQLKTAPRFVKKARLHKVRTVQYMANETYVCDTEKLHRICRVGMEGATTVIVTGKPRRLDCKLYSRSPFDQKHTKQVLLSEERALTLIQNLKY